MSNSKTTKENPYKKRALLYLPLSIMSIVYGIIHAFSSIGEAIPISLDSWGKYIFLMLPIIANALMFLVFYTQLFRGGQFDITQGTNNVLIHMGSFQMLGIVLIAYWYNLSYAFVVASLTTITNLSCVWMNKKSLNWQQEGQAKYRVRLELIWPSIYIVAIGIMSGFFLVVSERKHSDIETILPILIQMLLLTAYAFIMFHVVEDKKDKNTGEDKLHPFHIGAVIMLILLPTARNWCITTLAGKQIYPLQYIGLLAWAVAISSVFALFEAWAVVERRRSNATELAKYTKSANIVLVLLLILLPFMYIFTFNSSINPLYIAGLYIVGSIYFGFRYHFHDNDKLPSEGKIRAIKIFLTMLCFVILVRIEMIPSTTIKPLTEFLSEDIPILWGIITGLSGIGLVVSGRDLFVSVFKPDKLNDKQNLLFKWDNYKDTKNLNKQLLYTSLMGAFITSALILIWKEYIRQSQSTNPFPYTISMTCIYYIALALICLVILGVMRVIEINKPDAETASSTNHNSDDRTSPPNFMFSWFSRQWLSKLSELVHFPSSAMIFVLIFVPTLVNGGSFGSAFMRALPLTLAAMAGFSLNNFCDVEKDKVNKPHRAIPSGIISKSDAMQIAVSLYLLSAIIALCVSSDLVEMGICFLGIIGTICYSVFLKHIGYIKTLITGLLTALPFAIVLHFYNPNVNSPLFLIAIILSTIGKELLMDVRDITGDSSSKQKTIATIYGKFFTQIISIAFSVFALVIYAFSYNIAPLYGVTLITISAIIVLVSYLIWFFPKRVMRELGIYLLWGGIIVCSLPILI